MLPLIPHDKANHFAYGAVAATVAFVAATQFPAVNPFAHIAALFGAAVVGVAKEALDYVRAKSDPTARGVDKLDVVWTVAGGLPVFVAGVFA